METVPVVTEEGMCVAFGYCCVWVGESRLFAESLVPTVVRGQV